MKSDLLTLFAFFDCKDISEELFRDFCCSSKLQEIKSSTGPSSSLGLLLDESDKWDGDKFAEFLVNLNQHALLQTWSRESDDFCHFSLHPLTKDWILLRADLRSFQKYYTTAAEILAVFLEARYSHENFTLPLSIQQSILSHVDSLFEQKHNEKWDEKTSLELFRQVNQSELWFARLFFLSGRYNEAEEITLKILEFREREMGLEHELTLVALEEESKSLSRKGKDAEAIEMDHRRIRGCEKIYGTKDIRTFQAYNSLFSGLIEMELLVEAEVIYMNHLKEFEEQFGLEHPETLKCRINKGNLVRNQGRPAEAEIVYRGAIEAISKVYGPEHTFTFDVSQNLAILQFQQGKYLESENMFRELVEDRQRALGLDHPEILLNQTMVAWMLFKQDKGLEAEVLLREMVSQSNRILGPDDSWSLQIGNLLGLTLYHFERYDEAKVFFRDAADRSRRVLGIHNANCLQLLFHLGRVRHNQGQTDDALKLLEEVAEQREKTFGADNVATLKTKYLTADILYDVRENAKAASIYRDIAEQRKKTLGPDHPDTLVAQNDEAACLYREDKYNEDAELWEHVLHRKEISLDPEDLLVARSRANLTSTYMELKRYTEAEKVFSLTYEQRKRLLGPEAESTLDYQASRANALYALTRYDESAKVYESLAEPSRRVYGSEHGDTRQTLFRYAQALQALGKYQESENLYCEVLSAETKVLGLEKATTLQTVAYVAKILRLQEKNIEADEFMDQLTAGLESALDAATDKDFIQIFQRVGEELFEEKDFVHAEAIFRQVAASQEKAFGEVDRTFSRLAWVGKALYAQGKYSEAAETYKMLLERSEKFLGAESETTILFVWDLGNALRKDRKYTDADPLYRRLLDTLGKKAEVDEAETLKARGQYAALLRDQGLAMVEKENWPGAEEVYRGILKQGKLIDPDTEITIEALVGLGKILHKQERWGEVYDVYKRALDLCEKSLRGKKNRRKRRALRFRMSETVAAMGRGEDVWMNILELRPKHSTEREDL